MKAVAATDVMEADRQDGRALQYVPKEVKTPKLCMKAVKRDG